MTKSNILLSDATQQAVDNYLNNPSHALIIEGVMGSGKLALAKEIAIHLLGLENLEKLANYPYFMIFEPESKSITIDQVRQLTNFMKLRTTGTNKIRRVVVIDSAHLMTSESQNAILKLLEEPPLDSVIILTSINQHSLKPTVLSRSRAISIINPSLEQTVSKLKEQGYSEAEINRAYAVSYGAMGLLLALLSNETNSDLLELINEAKQLLGETRFDRLLKINELSKDKDKLPDKIYALKRVTHAAITQAVKKNDTKLIRHWINVLEQIQKAESALEHSVNMKLLLTNLFVQM